MFLYVILLLPNDENKYNYCKENQKLCISVERIYYLQTIPLMIIVVTKFNISFQSETFVN